MAGRELVLGDNGLSKGFQQENVRLTITKALRLNYGSHLKENRLLDFSSYHISLKYYRKHLFCLYLKLFKLEFHFLKSAPHLEQKNMSLHFESAPPHIWYLMQTFGGRLIPFPFVLWQSLKLPEPSLCVTCVWLNSSIELSGVNEEAIIAIVGRVITGAHRGAIMSGVSADGVKPAHKRSSTSYRLLPQR